MDKNLTLTEAGEAADGEDEESMAALTELAEEYGLDPDTFPTWLELAQALQPLMGEDAPDEEPAPVRRIGKVETLTREELEALSVPELRSLAKQLGVEGWEKNRSASLISGIIEAQGGGEEPAEDEDYPPKRRAEREANGEGELLEVSGFDGISAAALARGLRAFADALEG